MGTDPTKRAFYRPFRDLNPLNDLGIGSKPRGAAVSGRAEFPKFTPLRENHNF